MKTVAQLVHEIRQEIKEKAPELSDEQITALLRMAIRRVETRLSTEAMTCVNKQIGDEADKLMLGEPKIKEDPEMIALFGDPKKDEEQN